jgi:hypothetical protein
MLFVKWLERNVNSIQLLTIMHNVTGKRATQVSERRTPPK